MRFFSSDKNESNDDQSNVDVQHRADDRPAHRTVDGRTDTTASDTDVARTRPDATSH
jgi:hypothetical protein